MIARRSAVLGRGRWCRAIVRLQSFVLERYCPQLCYQRKYVEELPVTDARPLSRATPLPPSALFVELAQDAKPVSVAASNWAVELELGGGVLLHLVRG